jgi:type II secretory ATPase GspE/PulE/Tfp pilus assembly ATPase PilB-like protein
MSQETAPTSSSLRGEQKGEAKSDARNEKVEVVPPAQMIDLNNVPPERGVASLIEHAVRMGASDVFFVSNHGHVAVQVRHLGMVRQIGLLTIDQGRRYLSHIRVSAAMDVSERRRPSDGRWIYSRETGHPVDLRINTIPTMYGEDVAIRLLDRDSALFSLDKLGMGRDQLQRFAGMLESPSGLILICGPMGSGKTATLYAGITRMNNGRRKINTIEDPIEFAVEGVRQSQVNPVIGLGFGELLRSVLRQAPDVIMVGEIRDAETAQTAVHAANSGVLVLATVHAPSAAGAIQSMKALGVNPHFLAFSLRGVIAQRLARTLCLDCRISFDLTESSPETFDEVRPWLGPDEGHRLYAAQGCEKCGRSGYTGRTGIFEVMTITKEIRQLVAEGRPIRELRDKAKEQGMLEFRQSALLKVARGITSTEEVFRVIPTEHLMPEE